MTGAPPHHEAADDEEQIHPGMAQVQQGRNAAGQSAFDARSRMQGDNGKRGNGAQILYRMDPVHGFKRRGSAGPGPNGC